MQVTQYQIESAEYWYFCHTTPLQRLKCIKTCRPNILEGERFHWGWQTFPWHKNWQKSMCDSQDKPLEIMNKKRESRLTWRGLVKYAVSQISYSEIPNACRVLLIPNKVQSLRYQGSQRLQGDIEPNHELVSHSIRYLEELPSGTE